MPVPVLVAGTGERMRMDYFSMTQLATIAGATAATVLIVNVARTAFGFSAKWLALAVAVVIEALVWFFGTPTAETAFVGLLNACVVYASATGLNQIVSGVTKPAAGARDLDAPSKNWAAPWW